MFTARDLTSYSQTLPPFDQVVADEKLRQHITDQIHEACGMLMQLEGLTLCDIQVGVTEGRVVLSGNVECNSLRRLAESIARFTPDLVSITNQIQVGEQPSATTKTPASNLARWLDVAAAV